MNEEQYKEIVRQRYNDPNRKYSCDVSASLMNQISSAVAVDSEYRWNGIVNLLQTLITSTGSKVTTYVKLGEYTYELCVPDLRVVIHVAPTVSNIAYRDMTKIHAHRLDGVDLTDDAIKYGYRCIHFYDWDDMFKLAMLLQPRKRIGARECRICEVAKEDAAVFLRMYHLQDGANSYTHTYGLTYHDELVMVMVFGKPHFATRYQWQLRRFCTDPRYEVIGGASKLFSYFVKTMHPESIISYCDRSKFTGAVYAKMGMTIKEKMQPTVMWSRGAEVKSDYAIHRMGYQHLCHEGQSLSDRLLEDGWLPIYNCGQIVYEWRSSDPPCICSTEAPSKRHYTRNPLRYEIYVEGQACPVETQATKEDAIRYAQKLANSTRSRTRVIRAKDHTIIDEINPRGGIQ